MNPLISVVIPVYNKSKYVVDCLKSVTRQDYDNFEVIIIDDGSTDKSLTLCEEYIGQSKGQNFKLFHKQNGGLADARNFGIAKCSPKSEYVIFVDSDDEITSDCLSNLARYSNIDNLVIGSMKRCSSDCQSNETRKKSDPIFFEKIWGNEEFLAKLKDGIINSACAKCYSLAVIRRYGLSFENTLPEDTLFNVAYLKFVNKVVLLNNDVYKYYFREYSMSTNPKESIYINYMFIQEELFRWVPVNFHEYINIFVYPQYRKNTMMYVSRREYSTPSKYLSKKLIKRALNAYTPINFGDNIVHNLMKKKMFRILNLLLYYVR